MAIEENIDGFDDSHEEIPEETNHVTLELDNLGYIVGPEGPIDLGQYGFSCNKRVITEAPESPGRLQKHTDIRRRVSFPIFFF